jgi:uncharacterized protein YgiM (DUF1202 family)
MLIAFNFSCKDNSPNHDYSLDNNVAKPVNETPTNQEFPINAYIEDKDGYTNVRSSPNKSSEILTTVKEGEIFYTELGSGLNTFWKVKTKGGIIGYIHQSRIRSDDVAYMNYMKTLYKETDEKENTYSSSNKTPSLEEDINDLNDQIGSAMLGASKEDLRKMKKNRQFNKNEILTCKWCGKEFKANNGWAHNGNILVGKVDECMPVGGDIFYGRPEYCSKKCCYTDSSN